MDHTRSRVASVSDGDPTGYLELCRFLKALEHQRRARRRAHALGTLHRSTKRFQAALRRVDRALEALRHRGRDHAPYRRG